MKAKFFKYNWSTLFIISFATGLFFFTFFTKDKSLENFMISFLVSFLYTFVFSFGNYYTNSLLNERYSWIDDTKKRMILGVIATLFVNVIMVFACNYINFIILQKNDPAEFFSGNMGFVNWLIINIALLVSAILHAKGFVEEWKKATKKEVVEQKLIAKSANAQFESLKNQLDPHFLFNSLNVLSSLIDENPVQAQRFTASMSKIYRYVLEQKDKELVTVEEEIEFAKTYCELLKTRFEDSVSFEFGVHGNQLKAFVVPLSLQLLLENCIKHNFATSSRPLHIKIYFEKDYLFIQNNLQAREKVKESAGIGLANIVQRYSLLTKRNVFIERSKEFFSVKIPTLHEKPQTVTTKTSNSESLAYQKATKRVEELKGFYSNLISYCVMIPFLAAVNYYTSPKHIWFIWPLLGWGFGVTLHALQIYGVGNNWEEKKIRKMIDKQNLKK